MGFIGKQGRAGFISGNAFIKSALTGRLAYMHTNDSVVIRSTITGADDDDILIALIRAMSATGNILPQIKVMANGVPVRVTRITFAGRTMTFFLSHAIIPGDRVTWEYVNGLEMLLGSDGNEIKARIYSVTNPDPLSVISADLSDIDADTTRETADETVR